MDHSDGLPQWFVAMLLKNFLSTSAGRFAQTG